MATFDTGVNIRLVNFTLKEVALICAVALGFVLVYVGAHLVTGTAVGSPVVEEPRTVPVVKSCNTVPAKTYNKKLRIRRTITGNDQRFRSKPVCVAKWRELLRSIKKQRRICKASAITTGASVFGGAGDDNGIGYRGDRLFNFSDSFATLETGLPSIHAWPYMTARYFHANGRTGRGVKRDIGHGGDGVQGKPRSIDLHRPLANTLGISGVDLVVVAKRNCWA